MIGIVIVSHSAQLAEGVVELVRGTVSTAIPIAAAGGVAVEGGFALGTDAVRVCEAILSLSAEHTLVLVDMGSAILSADLARDLLPPEARQRVIICEAPLVEGAVAAAIQCSVGATLEETLAEMRSAARAKIAAAAQDQDADEPSGDALTLTVTLLNPLGLHARPAAQLAKLAGDYDAELSVRSLHSGGAFVGARSFNSLMMLSARQGHQLQFKARGTQAEAALAAVRALVEAGFGEMGAAAPGTEAPPAAAPALQPEAASGALANILRGVAVSAGLVVGAAVVMQKPLPPIPTTLNREPEAEWASFERALAKSRRQIEETRERAAEHDQSSADIFTAHLIMLDDDALLTPTRSAIFDRRHNAVAAWKLTTDALITRYHLLEDEYLRARALDMEDVQRRVLLNLLNIEPPAPTIARTERGILIAADLSPADVANLDTNAILGVCSARGSYTSHGAILARAWGIPAVVSLGSAILDVPAGTPLILDGTTGEVIIDPEPQMQRSYARRSDALMNEQRDKLRRAREQSAAPTYTRDHHRVEVFANIGSARDAMSAAALGAEGVGLFRTELLFMERDTPPSEDEQVEAYRAAAQALDGRPMIIRTLDIGGDKPIPYVQQETEHNPFLGWRGIRLCLGQPDVFTPHLRAILRAAALHPIRVMFPMIASLAELRAARLALAQAAESLRAEGVPLAEQIAVGIMVEVPSAALQAAQLAAEVDFFSIGTNDLTQYVFAAERGNPRVAYLSDALHPVLLGLIDGIVRAAHAHQRQVGICGEIAGDPAAIPILLGLEVDELSMSAPLIPAAKEQIRGLRLSEARALAVKALGQETAEAVRALAKTWS
jgi:phosphocarrier protein FPr